MSDKSKTEETPVDVEKTSLWTKVKNNRAARIAATLTGGALLGAVAVLALAGDEEPDDVVENDSEETPEDN